MYLLAYKILVYPNGNPMAIDPVSCKPYAVHPAQIMSIHKFATEIQREGYSITTSKQNKNIKLRKALLKVQVEYELT